MTVIVTTNHFDTSYPALHRITLSIYSKHSIVHSDVCIKEIIPLYIAFLVFQLINNVREKFQD